MSDIVYVLTNPAMPGLVKMSDPVLAETRTKQEIQWQKP